MSIYDIDVNTINGEKTTLEEYRNNWLLIVNTASKCGLVNQLEGLQELHENYKEDGLVVLGFPCDQFMHQEPLDSEGIKTFCQMNYSVTFPLYEKIKVNGSDTHPLYASLKDSTGGKKIKWNYTKFLLAPEAESIERFAPTDTPEKIEEKLKPVLK